MKAKDPVCGMMVDTERAPASGTYGGETVYFCAASCKKRFEDRLRSHPS